MARDMAHVRYMLQRHLNLRTRLTLNFCQIPLILTNRLSRISLIGRHHRQEIAILVHKARTLRQRTPLHIIPLAGDGKVQTYIYARILAQQTSCLGKPRRHDHHLNAGLNTILVTLHTSDIRRTERTHIVSTDYQSWIILLRKCGQRQSRKSCTANKIFNASFHCRSLLVSNIQS